MSESDGNCQEKVTDSRRLGFSTGFARRPPGRVATPRCVGGGEPAARREIQTVRDCRAVENPRQTDFDPPNFAECTKICKYAKNQFGFIVDEEPLRMMYIRTILFVASMTPFAVARTARVLASPDIPITSFTCSGRPIGYYADVENDCKTYHMCGEKGQMYSYACPNTTLFHQRMLICAHWYQVNCNRSAGDYSANLLIGQRDKPFVDDITANELNGVQSGERLQNLDSQYRKSYEGRDSRFENAPPTQVAYSSQVPRQDLVEAPSGSFLNGRQHSATDIMPPFEDLRPPIYEPSGAPASTPTRSTSVTEPTAAVFRPTNVSFRSTIETPNSESVLARTAPMTSARPFGRTESAFRASPDTVTTVAPGLPSLELLPPIDASGEETNTIELHLNDPRRAHYISKDGEIPRDEPIIVSINLPVKSRFRPQSPFAQTEEAANCPKCHPVFIVDRVNCSPCLLVS